MNIKNLLHKLQSLGITLHVELDGLRIQGKKEALTTALLYEIKAHKNELIKALKNPETEPYDPPLSPDKFNRLVSVVKILMKMDREAKETHRNHHEE